MYLQTFDRVKQANCWSDSVAKSALQNGFANSKVCTFISSIAIEEPYENIKLQIIKAFGFTIYDYQNRFHQTEQGIESFRQYVLKMCENFGEFCKLANVGSEYLKLKELIIKDQLLLSVNKCLSEYLREHDIFNISLEEVIKTADNYQSIHGRGVVQKNDKKINDEFSNAKKTCYVCGNSGHIAKFCKVKLGNYVTNPYISKSRNNSVRENNVNDGIIIIIIKRGWQCKAGRER